MPQAGVQQHKISAPSLDASKQLHLPQVLQNILPLLLAQLLETPDGNVAPVGNPLTEGGDLSFVQDGKALAGDLLHQPREAHGGGELMVAQEGEHVGAEHRVL